jgi:hypothetical protein
MAALTPWKSAAHQVSGHVLAASTTGRSVRRDHPAVHAPFTQLSPLAQQLPPQSGPSWHMQTPFSHRVPSGQHPPLQTGWA